MHESAQELVPARTAFPMASEAECRDTLAVTINTRARESAETLLPLCLRCASVSLACEDASSRQSWINALRACAQDPTYGSKGGGDGKEGDGGRCADASWGSDGNEAAEMRCGRGRELQELDCEEVDAWLQQTLKDISEMLGTASFDAAEVRRKFRANLVNGDGLLRLTNDHLKDMGIVQFGLRQQLLATIAQEVGMPERTHLVSTRSFRDYSPSMQRAMFASEGGQNQWGRSLPRKSYHNPLSPSLPRTHLYGLPETAHASPPVTPMSPYLNLPYPSPAISPGRWLSSPGQPSGAPYPLYSFNYPPPPDTRRHLSSARTPTQGRVDSGVGGRVGHRARGRGGGADACLPIAASLSLSPLAQVAIARMRRLAGLAGAR